MGPSEVYVIETFRFKTNFYHLGVLMYREGKGVVKAILQIWSLFYDSLGVKVSVIGMYITIRQSSRTTRYGQFSNTCPPRTTKAFHVIGPHWIGSKRWYARGLTNCRSEVTFNYWIFWNGNHQIYFWFDNNDVFFIEWVLNIIGEGGLRGRWVKRGDQQSC